jgi:DNA replication protein DnaC
VTITRPLPPASTATGTSGTATPAGSTPPASTPRPASPDPASPPPASPLPPLKGYDCPICHDQHWVYRTSDLKHPDFGKAFRCSCRESEDRARRTAWLHSIDGLTAAERTLDFADLLHTPENRPAIEAVTHALRARRGMVTLVGPPGTGKSTLLCCAVNAARAVNIPAVYTTLAGLLDHLRAAYDPGRSDPLPFDGRWDLLVRADLLAIDELDDFSATPWALERFNRLIDERWRHLNERLTLLATNRPLTTFPPKVASRLRDGRAQVAPLPGRDLRPLQGWEG